MDTITLHALSGRAPQTIERARIAEILETRFGGCGIVLKGTAHPLHFWESKEQVLNLLAPRG
ncbi:hypothetical protein [Noviherbaspirillum aridicola]|uniref:Uncharacterized protein n=1 Tax=Noviherbaspirillum aridicola TaxID=2849687 RepID=A0ABQ4PZT8_9BURK|nr:hypothetical protein [Noviherbaspirillum aridicola]GIZ50336.1 hypothetical protein NCCP691_03500 [Noviherbaspirillum aridicola]